MTIEEQIKSIIIQKYKSIRAFTQAINVPYSTIDSMLKKGIAGTSIQTVLRVCHALDVDVESIQSGIVKFSPASSKTESVKNDNLKDGIIESHETLSATNSELEIIKKYRQLDQRGQQTVLDTLNREYSYILKDDLDLSSIVIDAVNTIDMLASDLPINQLNHVSEK